MMKLYKGLRKIKNVDIDKFSKQTASPYDPEFVKKARQEAEEFKKEQAFKELVQENQNMGLYD